MANNMNEIKSANYDTLQFNEFIIKFINNSSGWRYKTLFEKEPETIEWINSFDKGDIFWDIGANVGIYSIYAGILGIKTFSFEPHFANYQQLCISIFINNLQELVNPLCLAFSNKRSIGELNLASLDVGTSMNNFGLPIDFRGRVYKPAYRQSVLAYDIDTFINDFNFIKPNHIKIDVDGLELSIINGASNLLKNKVLKSISIELIEGDIEQVNEVTKILNVSGFDFIHKKQNSIFATEDTKDVLNYLFERVK